MKMKNWKWQLMMENRNMSMHFTLLGKTWLAFQFLKYAILKKWQEEKKLGKLAENMDLTKEVKK